LDRSAEEIKKTELNAMLEEFLLMQEIGRRVCRQMQLTIKGASGVLNHGPELKVFKANVKLPGSEMAWRKLS
jgi:hypothetical protein